MEAVIIVLLVALLIVAGAALWLLIQRQQSHPTEAEAQAEAQAAAQVEAQRSEQMAVLRRELTQALASSQQTLLNQMNSVDAKLNQRFDAVQTTLGQSSAGTQDTMKHVNERLGKLAESTQQMLDVGRDISSLQEILQPPKVRGGFGELLLERLLAQILPAEHFSTQYRFGSGALVDAVIHLGGSLVPVDSKFPLESFSRMLAAETDAERAAERRDFVKAVRIHIDAVAKYIQPEDGTFPFAMMYIPAENVYYEIIVKDDLLDGRGNLSSYALEKRVIPVSPNSFYAYLQVIVRGIHGMQVGERANEIIRHLEQLRTEFDRFRQEFEVLGGHVGRTKNKYDELDKFAGRLGDRLQLQLHQPAQASLPEPAGTPPPASPPEAEANGTNGAGEPQPQLSIE